MILQTFILRILRYIFLISVLIKCENIYSQGYFRKYIDSNKHCDEFNNQVILKGDSIYLINYVDCDSLTQPLSSLLQLDFSGNIITNQFLSHLKINYNSANLKNTKLFIAGVNNSNIPDAQFALLKADVDDSSYELISLNLFDSVSNIYLVPIGSICFGKSQLIYGQFKKYIEPTVKGFLLWLDENLNKDSLMIFDDNMDWSIVSDATEDNKGNLVILLETVKIIENVEHHRRVIQKYNKLGEKIFEWISDPFYSDQGQGNITILNSGTVIMEYVSGENDFVHSLIAVDSLGGINWKWEFPLNEPYSVYRIFDMITSQGGDIICAGTYRNLDQDIIITGYLFKVSKEGELLWERIYVDRSESAFNELGLSEVIQFQSITETSSNDIVIGGRIIHSLSKPEENSDIFFAITDSSGCFYPECKKIQDVTSVGEFLDSSCVWTEGYSVDFIDQAWSVKYTVDSNPINIDNKVYYEVLKTNSEYSENWDETGDFIRFENNIVYLYRQHGEVELYNFNLELSDTFNVFLSGEDKYEQLIVEEIDTIVLLNGEQKKIWKLRRSEDVNPPIDYNYTYWIEGIGNIQGLMANEKLWFVDVGRSSLLCLYRDSVLIYDDPNIDGCWILTTSTHEAYIDNTLCIPNPSNEFVTIIGFNSEIGNIRVFNTIGRLVFQGSDPKIDISRFPNGYYYTIIELQNKQIFSKSFVKI